MTRAKQYKKKQSLVTALRRGAGVLAAIDLLLLEPEEKKAACNLWKACCDRGLVEHFDRGLVEHFDLDWKEEEY